jgi:subtilisin family serine protease
MVDRDRQVRVSTDASGSAHWNVQHEGPARLEIGPIPNHWSLAEDCHVDVPLREFQASKLIRAEDGLGWWHRAVGLDSATPGRGRGIRIGVIDTGCGPHPALSHAQEVGTFIDGHRTPGIIDEQEHGSHVCGIVAARPQSRDHFVGLAPDAELFVARVSSPARRATQWNIAAALDAMVDAGVHLINLSLGAEPAVRTIGESIENAWLHGILCFAAAGNWGGNVLWPARHELVIAVSALGREAQVPEGSLGKLLLRDAQERDTENDFVVPEFCSRGPAVTCCAPGVGIVSTLRTNDPGTSGDWGDMSGTSMASPLALGVLAILLSRDETFLTLAANEDRARYAREVLENQCFPLQISADCQGNGLPMLELAWG